MDGSGMLPEAFAGWYQVQESLSRLTGLEFALYNGEGRPVGLVSSESPFCRAIRRGGRDGSYCDGQCGRFFRESMDRKDVQYFTCRSGQTVFAVPLGRAAGCGLVIGGGKTFASRADYDKAVGLLKDEAGKVSLTGRHKYRFIGKKKLARAVELVKNAAVQHFEVSSQKHKYQLRHNRQVAMLENIAFLHHEEDLDELIGNLLESTVLLFEADTASLLLCPLRGGGQHSQYVYGAHEEAVRGAGEAFGREVLAAHRSSRENIKVRDRARLKRFNLPDDISSLISIPVYAAGELMGALSIFNTDIGPECLPAMRACLQQAAAIIDNKRLKGDVKAKMRGLKELVDMYARMGALTEPDEIFRFIFEKSAELIQAERGSLMLINEKTEELIVKVSKGMSAELGRQLRLKPGEGIAGGVASAGAPLMVQDIESDARLGMKKRPRYKTKSFISLPLRAEGRVIGVINLSDKITGEVFNQEDMDLLSGLASQASVALERAIYFSRAEELSHVSITDPRTGLLDRRYFNDRLLEEIERSRRYNRPFCLAVLAIDEFGRYNEAKGRQAGEEAVRKVSAILKSTVRINDILARYGNEEFAVILPETGLDKAELLAERIRRRVEAARFLEDGPAELSRLTVSIGLAGYPDDGDDLPALFANAYQALL